MKNFLPALLLSIGFMGLNAATSPVITNTAISKSAWYAQNGPTSKDLVLDPVQPYVLTANAQCAQSSAGSIISATVTFPSGSIPMFKAKSLGSNTGGVILEEFFTNKTDMDAVCPIQSSVVFSINVLGQVTNYTQSLAPDVYPQPPLINIDSNGFWSSQGYIIVQNPQQPVTISWPKGNNLYSSLKIGNSFSTPTTSGNNFTFSANLLSQLPTGVILPILLNQWIAGAAGGCFNNFAIYIPPTPPPLFSGTPLLAAKQHLLVQTNTNSLADYIPKIAPKGDYYQSGYGPYSFDITGPQLHSVTTPKQTVIYSKVSQNGYSYSSGALSKAQLDSQFTNGVYSFSTGQRLSITGDMYPNPPKIISVNGKAPLWSNGMLVLAAANTNNITWSSFVSGNTTFSSSGLESVQLFPANFADWGSISPQYTNILACPAAGLGESGLITNQVLPTNYLTSNVNYTMTISYGTITSSTNQPCISGAGYISQTIIPIIAQ